jgi:hypothetical protein
MLRSTLHIEAHSPAAQPSPCNSQQPVLDFIASDESLDRYDEVISASGWRLDSYRRNPVFQNAHQYGDIMFTLGKALVTEVRNADCGLRNSEELQSGDFDPRSALRAPHSALPQAPHSAFRTSSGFRTPSYLFQRIEFATEVNPIARIAYGLYKGKFLNAVSVGFIPLRWEDSHGIEHSAGKSSQALSERHSFEPLGLSAPEPFRRRYLEQELLEVSAVGIPANPNALALGLKAGAIEKSDLREMLALLRSVCGAIQKNPGDSSSQSGQLHRNLQLLSFARELRRLLRRA